MKMRSYSKEFKEQILQKVKEVGSVSSLGKNTRNSEQYNFYLDKKVSK